MDRLVPWLAAAVLVGAMVAPAVVDPPRDGFPLSTYPMFATDRGDHVDIDTAVGLLDGEEMVRLSPQLLAGTSEPILAVRTARESVAEDRSQSWCEEVAARLAAADHPAAMVEVRTESHNVMASVVDGNDPLAVAVHARCPVGER